MKRHSRIGELIAAALLLVLLAIVWLRPWSDRAARAESGKIVVVEGGEAPAPAIAQAPVALPHAAAATPPAADPLAGDSLVRRQLAVRNGPPDTASAARLTAWLGPDFAEAQPGLSLVSVLCGGGMCEVDGRLSLDDRRSEDAAIAYLTGDAIPAMLRRVGLSRLSEVSIERDTPESLAFTVHGKLPST